MILENSESRPSWSLVTSHGLVLFYIANHASATIREVAAEVGLTERRVLEILKDLEKAQHRRGALSLGLGHLYGREHHRCCRDFGHPGGAELSPGL